MVCVDVFGVGVFTACADVFGAGVGAFGVSAGAFGVDTFADGWDCCTSDFVVKEDCLSPLSFDVDDILDWLLL